ncbi:hypothetical protein CVU82_00355 [Candidatus Falkowbacteria bacterium HGW-Falkowbacteria-1]|jgi:hypothetical protein|uniref:Uncharacterized protein n=1 Tax=Candidatus Falkowbacteria bacterium HGW-Falkowbacteria-1 TaxID=2013768 RepID=A0A2N2EA97_9BACT|nr:MAG: hypothetical protein CVU82_00355 [Candidatus Falkowbacteria bacterium HGW-Falkowbacteria-1]
MNKILRIFKKFFALLSLRIFYVIFLKTNKIKDVESALENNDKSNVVIVGGNILKNKGDQAMLFLLLIT